MARSVDVHQTVPIKHAMYSADRGELDILVLAADLLADLRSAPARVLALDLKDQLLDLKGQLAALPVGSAASVRQSFQSGILVSIKDFVSGFARDIELAAQHRHLL